MISDSRVKTVLIFPAVFHVYGGKPLSDEIVRGRFVRHPEAGSTVIETAITLHRKGKRETALSLYPEEDGTSLPLVTFDAFQKLSFLSHGFTTRYGGASSGIFDSMDLSFTRGDDRELVCENYRRVAGALGTEPSKMCLTRQVHHTNVCRVTEENAGNGVTIPQKFDDMDGFITDTPGLFLVTSFADCVPLMFADPVHRAIGSCHSGWRGTVGKIGAVTIHAMEEAFHTDPKDLVCVIGPSICRDCYEVSDDVADAFRKAFPGHEDEILYPGRPGHAQLDLPAACRITMTGCGVPDEQIHTSDLCTKENSELLFSHRASRGQHGNFCGILGIRS